MSVDWGRIMVDIMIDEPEPCKYHLFGDWLGEEHIYLYRVCKHCGYTELKRNINRKSDKND